jgi:hypothetical protein
MLIAMPNWPQFSPAEFPGDMPDELLDLLPSLHGSCIIVQSAVYDHAILAYMKSNPQFDRKIRKSSLAAVINQIEISLTKSLVLSMASLFNPRPGTVNIRHMLKIAAKDQWLPILQPRHVLRGENVLQKRDRLIRMQRRMSRPPLKEAIERVKDFRDKGVAHVDMHRNIDFKMPRYGDISLLLLASANIVASLLSYLTYRRANAKALHFQASQQAKMFGQAIQPPTN